MLTKKLINNEMLDLEALRELVWAYEEIAASQMHEIRDMVLRSRRFLQELLTVFSKIRTEYSRHKGSSKGIMPVVDKTVAVLVTANSGLYGDLVDNIFKKFANFVVKNNPEVCVLGKVGVRLMADKLPRVLYNYFDFSDEEVEQESMEVVVRYLVQFKKIIVFHGQFKSVLNQEAVQSAISGDVVEMAQVAESVKENMAVSSKYIPTSQYLFEPSIDVIEKLFEGEILASVFEQTVYESFLAKFAARLFSLDRSVENIDTKLNSLFRKLRILGRSEANKKQILISAAVPRAI